MNDNRDFAPFEDSDGDSENMQNDASKEHFDEEMADMISSEEEPEATRGKSGFFGKKNVPKGAHQKEEISHMRSENKRLEEEKEEIRDKFLRLYSEFDNYKKRTQKEKIELIDTASEKVILDLLEVVDDFERAIEANKKIDDSLAVKEGFEIIYHKLLHILSKNGVEELPAKGELFNTDFHEAVAHIPVEDDEKGIVMDVLQKGYSMRGKVIRYAKVVVGN